MLGGRDEPIEVAAETVVHGVHAGLVVRALGGVALAGEGQLVGPGGRVGRDDGGLVAHGGLLRAGGTTVPVQS